MVATSLSGKKRSLTRRLMARRLSSDVNWPLTRSEIRSGPACTTPEGCTAFWFCSVSISDWTLRPSAASLRVEKSR